MYLNSSYKYFEEYIQHLNGWDVDIRKLDTSEFYGTLSLIDCQPVQIVRFNFNGILDRYGSSPKGYTSFVIPGDSNQSYHWFNEEIDSSVIAKFSESRELDMLSKGPFSSIGLNIYTRHFYQFIEQYNFPKLHKLIRKEDQVFQLSIYETSNLANYIHKLFLFLEKKPGLIKDPEFRFKVQYILPYLLLDLLEKSGEYKYRKVPDKTNLALQQTVPLINSNIHDHFSIADLSIVGGISEGTLLNSFHQKFGVTPIQYIKRSKLNKVRQELSDQDNTSTIKAIISQYGINHFGQFSKDYYKLFNELPSETRKRNAELP